MVRVFRDRHDAGAQLARALHGYADAADVVVLAHMASSVPVAYEVATRLGLALDLVTRDVCGDSSAHATMPLQLVVREDGDEDIILLRELSLDVANRIVLLVDDGDGARAMPIAIERMRGFGATSVIAAVAVASPQVCAMLHAAADRAVCVLTPQHIYSTSAWYADLSEPSADEIRQLLVAAAQNRLVAQRPRAKIAEHGR